MIYTLRFSFILFICCILNVSASAIHLTTIYGDESEEAAWHSREAPQIEKAYDTAKIIDPGSQRNVATFQITLTIGSLKLTKPYDDCLFLSGGNKAVASQLAESLGKRVECIANYCPLVAGKPKDFALRSNIVEFFGFSEAITGRIKSDIASAYVDCIKEPDYFSEIVLTDMARQRLTESLQHALLYRQFDEESDRRARTVGLIDKARDKPTEYDHINNLFGQNFQLNFGDSEQTIRLFFDKVSLGHSFVEDIEVVDLPGGLVDFENHCQIIRQLVDDDRKSKSKEQKQRIQNEIKILEKMVIPGINAWISEYMKGRIDIASSYDMCANCQATYRYDNEYRHHLALGVIRMFAKGLAKNDAVKNVAWCLRGWTHSPSKSGILLSVPVMSLTVSSFMGY